MKHYVKIITDDIRFKRMLSLELYSCGIEEISDIGCFNCDSLSEENFFAVIDLDFCQEDDIAELCSKYKVIGFSYKYKGEIGKKADMCYAFFHRPFLISEFLSVIFHQGEKIIHEKSIRRRTRLSSLHEKKSYLSIDGENRCAVWGNNKILLSDNELKIMSALCDRMGYVVTREELSKLIGGASGNMCDVYICMLRKKIDDQFGVKLIYTVRGKGYMIK